MREAQLGTAEEFDLLIVIICSSCSVAERISEKQAGAEIVFMLLLDRRSNCLKTWAFSRSPISACYQLHFHGHSRAGWLAVASEELFLGLGIPSNPSGRKTTAPSTIEMWHFAQKASK